jgi:hypothetical protein
MEVPVLVKSSDHRAGLEDFINALTDKPFFCFAPELNSWLGMRFDPSFKMMADICAMTDVKYKNYKDLYSEPLYYRNLFFERPSGQ